MDEAELWRQIRKIGDQVLEEYCYQCTDMEMHAAVEMLYRHMNLPMPSYIVARSARECAKYNAILTHYHKARPEMPTAALVEHVKTRLEEDIDAPWVREEMVANAHYHVFWHWVPSTESWYRASDLMGVSYDASQRELLVACGKAFETGFTYKEAAVISRKPLSVKWVDRVLSCEDGPAAEYADGYKLWAIGGVHVDEQIVMRPETQTIAQIDGEQNIEVKRLRIERYGWERFLTEKGATVLDHRRNDIEGTDESLMQCDDMAALVCVCPSTGRVYCLEVPPATKTCSEAQDYLCNSDSSRIIGRT